MEAAKEPYQGAWVVPVSYDHLYSYRQSGPLRAKMNYMSKQTDSKWVNWVLASIVMSVFAATSLGRCEDKPRARDLLDREQEKALRTAVYNDTFGIGLKIDDEELPRNVLIVPEVVHELFEKHPIATLECLLKIAEGARPADSQNACAFAYGAGRKYAPGWQFMTNLEKYEDVNVRTGQSQRDMWIEMIRERIVEIKKKRRDSE